MDEKNLTLDDFPLSEKEWNDLGVRMLSLKFMDAIRHSCEPPLGVEDLARISGLPATHMRQLCVGNRVVSLRVLHVLQKAMEVHFGLEIKKK